MDRRIVVTVFLLFAAPCVWAQEAKQPPVNPAPGVKQDNPVVVRVLGESITEKQVLAAIDDMARRSQLNPQQMQQKNSILFKDAVDNLIGLALIKDEGKAMKVTADPAKVEEAYDGLAKRFPSPDEFKKALSAQGMTEADLRKNIQENLMYQTVLDQAVKGLPAPTDSEVKKFYDENPQFFVSQEQVHAAHILLKVDPKAAPEKKAEAKSKLESLRADIEAKKITFSEAAAKNSQDTGSAQNGGDLGFFSRGQMVKPFEDTAFSTKPGTLSPVTETDFGYHLIYVIEHKQAGKVPLEEAQNNIKTFLENKAKQDAIQKHIADLRQKVKVDTEMTVEEWNKRNSTQKN